MIANFWPNSYSINNKWVVSFNNFEWRNRCLRKMVKMGIRLAHPGISEREITAKFFERYYGHEFSTEQKAVIIKGILEQTSA